MAKTARDYRGESRSDNRGDRSDNRGESRTDYRGDRSDNRGDRSDNRNDNRGENRSDNRGDNRSDNRNDNRGDGGTRYDNRDNRGSRSNDGDDDERGGRRRNRQRSRDRKRGGTRRDGDGYGSGGYGGGTEQVETIHEDDVLIPVAGILDVLDNYAFVRTSGYLPGENDVYVSLGKVKKYGLRKGDAVVGAIQARARATSRAARSSTRWSGSTRSTAVPRGCPRPVEFGKLTPLYPQERLRLETEPTSSPPASSTSSRRSARASAA